MDKPSQFIFLTTNELSKEGQICHTAYGYAISGKDGIGMGQHLYILSDDEIKEGDWFLTKDGSIDKFKGFNLNVLDDHKYLYENTVKGCYNIHGNRFVLFPESFMGKITATTNPELWKKTAKEGRYISIEGVDKISQSDIEYIISLYNGKGKEVNVMDSANLLSKITKKLYNRTDEYCEGAKDGFILGYDECLQDNADKKFTLDDIEKVAIEVRRECANKATTETWHKKFASQEIVNTESILSVDVNKIIQSIIKEQPKSNTVMVEYELKVCSPEGFCIGSEGGVCDNCKFEPKLKDGFISIVR